MNNKEPKSKCCKAAPKAGIANWVVCSTCEKTFEPELVQEPKEESCPVCGYYCLGKGGMGCIDKPASIIPKEEKCYSCGGKGTYSQIHGDHGAEDFGGEGYENKPSIHNYPCRACNGTGVKPKEEKCKSSPLCSHNTNGRNMNKPCSIAISSSPTLEETEQKCFEANILDGDDINDCGGAMVSAKEAFSYMLERIRAAREEGLIHGRKECYRDMADLDKILVGENFDEWYEKLSQKVKEAPFIHIAFKHGLDQMYKKGRSAALEEAKGILLKIMPVYLSVDSNKATYGEWEEARDKNKEIQAQHAIIIIALSALSALSALIDQK